jgi:hypothetical protein
MLHVFDYVFSETRPSNDVIQSPHLLGEFVVDQSQFLFQEKDFRGRGVLWGHRRHFSS